MKQGHLLPVLFLLLLASGCVTLPKGAVPVASFDIRRYLGTWYEIARLDFKYEKGLEQVTATYTQKDKHTISVDNKGYDTNTKRWKESRGKAKIVSNGRLKVSFFGPFYAGYNIIAIDPDYRYALIAGNNLKYLWLLSRDKTMPSTIREQYLEKARALGYATGQLVWTRH